jgi:hypothetical protein
VAHPFGEQLARIGEVMELALLKGYVAEEFEAKDVARAYEAGNERMQKMEKVVLKL